MVCEPVTIERDGKKFGVLVCGGRSRRRLCTACNALTDFLCDWPDPKKKSGMCDEPCCPQHYRAVAPDTHYCIHHWKEQDMANQVYIKDCIGVEVDQIPFVGRLVFGRPKPVAQIQFTEKLECGHIRVRTVAAGSDEARQYRRPLKVFCEQCRKEAG